MTSATLDAEDAALRAGIGELDEAFFEQARVRRAGTVVREASATIASRGRPRKADGERKEAISLRLSPHVLAHFRSSGPGWQTRIDEALQAAVALAQAPEPSEDRRGATAGD